MVQTSFVPTSIFDKPIVSVSYGLLLLLEMGNVDDKNIEENCYFLGHFPQWKMEKNVGNVNGFILHNPIALWKTSSILHV